MPTSPCSTHFRSHSSPCLLFRERQKLKVRDEAWKRLRDSALANSKAIGAVAPKNLTDEELAPRSSTTELLSLSDSDSIGSIGDMTGEEEEGTARGAGSSFLERISPGLNNHGGNGGPISASDSGPSDFDFAGQDDEHETGPASSRSGPSTPRVNSDQVDDMKRFPETARASVAQKGQESPHVRRKSVIPMDPTVLQELQHHKSLDEP